jgi:hypothetical protein
MTGRSIKPKQTPDYWQATIAEFPKEMNGIIYVRQSSLAQMKNNIHSFEMQTEKFLAYFREMGCTGRIDIIPDDEEGKTSGTLDIHQRPGLTRVVDRVEHAEEYNLGWIAAVHVNRFTRDPWLITPAVLMKTCHEHNVWIATLRMLFNFKDEYCQRVFMLEAEESARHLKWMKLVLGGSKLVASGNGYYDGRNLATGYIVDRTDPKHMKIMVYPPHAEIVFWMFKRYLVLDGNFPALCREVDAMPYLFPPFEGWVDPKDMGHLAMKQFTEGAYQGYYKPTANGLKSILTNPVYIGWWIPIEGEVIINHHEPIVPEDLFWYAYKRLATHTLNGERIKPMRVTRQHTSEALLIKVIRDEEDCPIYVEEAEGRIVYKKLRSAWMGKIYGFRVQVATIDRMFREKLFERVEALEAVSIDWEDTVVKAKEERETRNNHIKKAIKEAERKMKHIMALLSDPDQPLPASMKSEYIQQYSGLEAKKQQLEQDLIPTDEEEEEQSIYKIQTLIPRIRSEWDNFTYGTRLLVVSGLVRKVVLSQPASGWLKMEIEWKFPSWGIDEGHIRKLTSKAPWTEKEDQELVHLYPTSEVIDLLRAFPNRSLRGIAERAMDIQIRRELTHKACIDSLKQVGIPRNLALEDYEYAMEHGLSSDGKNAQWSPSPCSSPHHN